MATANIECLDEMASSLVLNDFPDIDDLQEINLYGEFGVFSQVTENPAEIEAELIRDASRFPDVGDLDVSQSVANARCKNTDKATKWGMGIFLAWAKAMKMEATSLHEMTVLTMNNTLAKFFLAARKHDGTPYPSESLYLIACAVLRYLREHGRADANFLDKHAVVFNTTRAALDARMKEVTKAKVNIHTKQAQYLTREDEQKLWDKGQCGYQTSRSLLQTIFYYNCKLFGLRAGAEHRSLSVDDFTIKRKGDGKIIEIKGWKAKNYQGGLKDIMVKPKSIQHFCHKNASPSVVEIYELYFSAIENRDPFYRRPLACPAGGPHRFANVPIGKNMLGTMIKDMCDRAGISGYFTNHSEKHTAATQLFQAGIEEQLIMERTGHRSIGAVRKYKHTNFDQISNVSDILNPPEHKKDNNSTPSNLNSGIDDEPTSTVKVINQKIQ